MMMMMMIMEILAWFMVFLLASKVAYKVILRKPSNGGGSKHKVLKLLPILPLFLYLPWLPSSLHIRVVMTMMLIGTAPTKLFLLCFNKPLDPFPLSFSYFLVIIFLPIHISSLSSAKASSGSGYGYGFMGKLLLLVGILNIYPIFSHIPSPLLDLLYCFQTYISLDLGMGALARIVERAFSVTLYAQFNEPFKSTSLTDFWGRRWNLTVNCMLKETIYKPLLKLHVSKILATLATFAVSGLAHEIVFVYASQSGPTGEMAAFFLLHGLAVVAQVALCKQWPALRGLPTWICQALTLAFLFATVSLLFMPPLRRSKMDIRINAEEIWWLFLIAAPLVYNCGFGPQVLTIGGKSLCSGMLCVHSLRLAWTQLP